MTQSYDFVVYAFVPGTEPLDELEGGRWREYARLTCARDAFDLAEMHLPPNSAIVVCDEPLHFSVGERWYPDASAYERAFVRFCRRVEDWLLALREKERVDRVLEMQRRAFLHEIGAE